MALAAADRGFRRLIAVTLVATLAAGPGAPVAAAQDAAGPVEPDEPLPEGLAGDLFVFDLRRLELFRAEADGTRIRKVELDLGDAQAAGLAAGSVGAAAGAGVGLEVAAAASGLGASTAGAAAMYAAAGGILVVGPTLGIMKAVKVAKRRHRPVRVITQVQPIVAIAPGADRLLFCTDVAKKVGGGNFRVLELHGDKGRKIRLVGRLPFGGPCPEFAPDGKSAIFIASPRRKEGAEIYLTNLTAATPEQLTSDDAPKAFPRYSPDGSLITCQAIVIGEDGLPTTQVVLVDPEAGTTRTLTHDAVGAVTPAWLPDGTAVAYASLADGAIHAALLDGGEPRRLTEGGNVKLHPQLSADGALVMYLESTLPPQGLGEAPPGAGEAARKKTKQRLGKDFRLRVTRIADGREWSIPLARGGGDVPEDVLEKTNLFWFRWQPRSG